MAICAKGPPQARKPNRRKRRKILVYDWCGMLTSVFELVFNVTLFVEDVTNSLNNCITSLLVVLAHRWHIIPEFNGSFPLEFYWQFAKCNDLLSRFHFRKRQFSWNGFGWSQTVSLQPRDSDWR